ncbi:uncharacterized protein LOC110707993 [Chenopodium quinoa]|uniref:uncharacterized protein LOC110707993 n=1 Tax=Chenopodium quinoa TaxID=63459 RepID=UPI000B76C362|nr:uncharacterized protein LOC110707993 [Chenopodium quinoa]
MGENPRVALKKLGIPGAYRFESGIAPPTTPANDFEIRLAMITFIERLQFSGAKHESPLNHFKEFEKYCNTIRVNGVSQEFIRLKLFPFSLIGRALEWLDKEVKPNSLRTWDEVTKEFISRFYSQKKTAEARALIQSFKQRSNESLYEAWERYKDYQRECPHHGIPTYQIIQIFYGGLSPQRKSCLDAGAGGPIMNKTEEEVVDIIEDVVRHYMYWQDGERESTSKSGSMVYSFDHLNAINNLSSQISNLWKEMTSIKAKLESASSLAPILPSQNKGRGTSSNSSPLSTSNNMPSGCLFCDICGSYEHDSCNCPHAFSDGYDDFDSNESDHVNYVSNNNNGSRFDNKRGQGNRNYHNQGNFDNYNQGSGYRNRGNQGFRGIGPKKPAYSITTRSGKVLEESISRKSQEGERVNDSFNDDEHDVSSKKCEVANEKAKIGESVQNDVIKPKLPYPQKFLRSKIDDQFGRFLDMLKEIHLSIPFTDALKQMPNYSKFLKEILSGKRECNEVDSMKVGECCCALIHNDLPKKMKDPGNFSIPCNINGKVFQNNLCELGASVNIMPYPVFKNLKLGELLPTNLTLQLADRSIKFPKGRIEDVPLKIGEFTILVDFIVLEVTEDDNIPIILGRPFLATSGALIDVKGGIITLCVGNDLASFKLKPIHESLSFVQGIMCINSLHLNDMPCTLLLSTNDAIKGCDNASIIIDIKLVSDGKKETSCLEDVIEMSDWFGLSLKDDVSSGIDGMEFFALGKKKTKKRKKIPKNKKEKLKHNKFDPVFMMQDDMSHDVVLPKLGNDFSLFFTLDKVAFFDPS